MKPVKVFDDGREVCDLSVAAGRREYRRRVELMLARQGGRCCLEGHAPMCPGFLRLENATFEHEDGRGSGGWKRDDRTEKTGLPYNGAAHPLCNGWKGSRVVDYNGRHQ